MKSKVFSASRMCVLLVVIFFAVISSVSRVGAQDSTRCVNKENPNLPTEPVTATGCRDGWEKRTVLINPLLGTKDKPAGTTDVTQIIGNVLKAVIGIMGGIVIFIFVRGASNWIFAAGNPEKIKKGTQAMIWAAIGVVIVLISGIMVGNIISALGPSPTPDDTLQCSVHGGVCKDACGENEMDIPADDCEAKKCCISQ